MSITFTLVAVLISIYLSTFDLGVMVIFPAVLAISGLVLQLYTQRRFTYDEEITAPERRQMILYAVVGLATLGVVGWFSTQAFPQSIVTLSVIDRKLFGVQMAVAEEQFFRGFLTSFFMQRWGMGIGVLLSGVVFGAYHLAVYGLASPGFVYATLAGMVLSYVAIKTQRVSVPMCAHILNNLVAM